MGNFKIKSIWETKNTGGGNVPAGLENRVQDLETNAVKITGAQSIAGVKTFTSTGEVIKLNSGNNNATYIAGYKSGNNRIWYFGKGSTSDDNFVIGSSANIKLEAASAIQCNNKRITQVADPTVNTDATTKQYVDNRIQKRVIDANVPRGTDYIIEPSPGYEIISVMAGRRRSAEGYYFFQYQSSLNFQLYLHTDRKYHLYTEGAVSGFGPEYKIIVIEMKV